MLHRRRLTGFWICHWFSVCQSFEYTNVLNIPGFSEYIKVLTMPLVLNTTVLHITEFLIYVRLTQGSEYVWITLKYARICVNKPKSARKAFVLHVPISILCLLATKFIVWRNKMLFSGRDNLIFSIVSGTIWFVCFRLNMFTKILNLLLLFKVQVAGGHESWYNNIK